MKFTLTRTSMRNEKPHEHAVKEIRTYVDVRTVDNPKKIIAHRGTDGGWYDKGTNHRVHNGHIMRDREEETIYTIKIDSLEELINFCRDCGEEVILLVGEYADKGEEITLEIYDDYRE